MKSTSTFEASDGNEYTVSDRVGGGGQGAVFRGRRVADGTEVAIKRIKDGAERGPTKNRELEIAMRLSGASRQYLLAPNSWAIDGNDLLLVMPLAEHSLADLLAQHPDGLPEDEAVSILRDITTGLTELRAAEIVHRDLKPANILFIDGRWHVADFGMSRDLDVSTASASATFTYGGTPWYAAPERWRALPATYKTDLYALGCIGFELLTGHLPFPGPDTARLQHQHLHVPPPSVPAGAALARWIMRLLDKDPAIRHQDAQAALTALPTTVGVDGQLAAAALQRAQRRQQEAAAQAAAGTTAEVVTQRRRQAIADLADICATAADHARGQLPDVDFSSHGGTHRFSIDDVELVFTLWGPFGEQYQAVLAGEITTVIGDRRRCAANVVCERSQTDRLTWYFDSFTRSPFAGVVEAPSGFDDQATYFEHYAYFQFGGLHTWQRQRLPLTAQLIVDTLAALLLEASQP